jgi:TP901 family phage tail tape measure protein
LDTDDRWGYCRGRYHVQGNDKVMFDKIDLSSLFNFVDTSLIQPSIDALKEMNSEYSKLSRNLTTNSKKLVKAQEEVTKAILANEAALKNLNITTEAGRASVVSVTVEVGKNVRAHTEQAAALRGVRKLQDDVKGSLNELTARLAAQRAEFAKLSASEEKDAVSLFRLAGAIRGTISDMGELRKAARGVNSEYSALAGSYNNLDNQTKQLVERLKQMPGGLDLTTQEARELNAQINQNVARLKAFDTSIGSAHRSVGQYAQGIMEAVAALQKQRKELLDARSALEGAKASTRGNEVEQDKLQKELAETNAALAQVNQQLKSYGVSTDQAGQGSGVMARNLKSFITSTALAYFSLQALQRVLGEIFEANVKFSDSLVAVQKTTGLAGAEVEQFVEALKQIPTRTSLSGLLDIAKVGGQLGIAKKDILGFTTSIDIAVQALSDDFEGGAEVIANALGKINSIFKVSENVGIDRALLDIGSAINELAASGVATAPFLADYARRVGAIASNAGLGLAPVLAMGAALEELGFTSEVAGTATNRLISGLSTKTSEFYAIAKLEDANLTLKDFKKLINSDFQGALNLFLAGLNKGGQSTTAFATLIKSLGLKSGEAVSVLTSLARNIDLVDERLVIANRELDNGNSLAKEAKLRNEDLAGSYEKLKNKLINLATSPAITSFFKQAIDFAAGGFLGGDKVEAKPLLGVVQGILNAGIAARDTSAQAAYLIQQLNQLSEIRLNPKNFSGPERAAALKTEQNLLAQLTSLYGEGTVTLNEQTKAYELNAKAAMSSVKGSQKDFKQAQVDIAKQLVQTNAEIRKQEALQKAAPEVQAARIDIAKQLGITPEALKAINAYNIAKEEFDNRNVVADVAKNPTIFGPLGFDIGGGAPEAPEGATDAQIKAVKELSAAQRAAADPGKQLNDLYMKRNFIMSNLNKLGLDNVTALRLANEALKAVTPSTEDNTNAELKAAKAKHDLLHAQFELNKANAEARLQAQERISVNPANDEKTRNKALIQATKERMYIERLEANEGIRQSKERNKEIIGGQEIFNTERATLQVRLNAALKKLGNDGTKEQADLRIQMLDKAADVDKLILSREIYNLEQIRDNELLSYEERTKAAQEAADRRVKIAEAERDAKIRAAKGEALAIKAAQEEFKSKEKEIRNPKGEVKPFDSAKANDTNEQMMLQQLIDLEDKYAEIRKKGKISDLSDTKKYEQEKFDIERKFQETMAGNMYLELGDTKAVLDEKLRLRREANAKELEIQKAHLEQMGELINMAIQETQVIFDGYADIRRQQRDNDLANLTEQRDNEIAIAGDNAKAKSKIENEYDAKSRKIKRDQARADKMQALFNIALNTAMAVTSVLSTGGGTRYADFGISAGILSGIVIAQGAIQAGLVLAKPLPAYFRGTTNSEGGPALVAERGPELIEKNGQFSYITKPSIVELEKGSTVHTAQETKRIIREVELRNISHELAATYVEGAAAISYQQHMTVNAATSPQELATALTPAFRTVVQAIEDKEQVLVNFTKDGIDFQVRKGQMWTTYVNHKYYRGKTWS